MDQWVGAKLVILDPRQWRQSDHDILQLILLKLLDRFSYDSFFRPERRVWKAPFDGGGMTNNFSTAKEGIEQHERHRFAFW